MNSKEISIIRLFNQSIASPKFKHPADVLLHMGAIQGQDYTGAKYSLGLRTDGATDKTVENAFSNRSIVRTWLMRGTLHLVAAKDIRWINDLFAARLIASNDRRYRELELDEPTLKRSGELMSKSLQDAGKLNRKQLMAMLEGQGISTKGQRAAYMLQRATLDNHICQCGVTRNVADYILTAGLPEAKQMPRDEALTELARRYFFSRGPATIADFVWWSGLTVIDAKKAVQAIKGDLEEGEADGQAYFFKPLDRFVQDMPSVYLLPGFDEYLLGYKNRIASLQSEHSNLWCPGGNGMFYPFVVIHGKFRGTWKRVTSKKNVSIHLALTDKLNNNEKEFLDQAMLKVNSYYSANS